MHLLWDSGNGRWVRLEWVSHRSFVFGRPCSLETSEFVGLNKGWEKGQYNVSVKLLFLKHQKRVTFLEDLKVVAFVKVVVFVSVPLHVFLNPVLGSRNDSARISASHGGDQDLMPCSEHQPWHGPSSHVDFSPVSPTFLLLFLLLSCCPSFLLMN